MKGNEAGVHIIPLASELAGMYPFVHLAGVGWIKMVEEKCIWSVGGRCQEAALGLDPALGL